MITDLTIQGLRGIKEGSLEGLTPLTLLLGPNGSGKSTILEALYLAASPVPGEAIGQVVTRRSGVASWPRWLFWRGAEASTASIWTASQDFQPGFRRELYWEPTRYARSVVCRPDELDTHRVWTRFLDDGTYQHGVFDGEGRQVVEPLAATSPGSGQVRFLDVGGGFAVGLHVLYSLVSETGRRDEVRELLRPVVPGLDDLEILTEGDTPVLHTRFKDRAVPAVLAGDGVAALLRLALEVVGRSEGVALVEEPEAHQHPRAIAGSAAVLAGAVKRGVQVIASTHSMEFVDHLLNALYPEDLDRLSLWRTRLDNGILRTSRLSGAEVADARQAIEEDLR